MGDNWLQYVPVDAHWRPTPEAAEKAAAYVRSVVEDADEVNVEFSDEMKIFHPFANWDGVACPACGAECEALWSEALDRWAESGFKDISLTMSCCGVATTLNDLNYAAPTAFGHFMLEVMNPRDDTTTEQDAQVAALIGAPLRKVWVHL